MSSYGIKNAIKIIIIFLNIKVNVKNRESFKNIQQQNHNFMALQDGKLLKVESLKLKCMFYKTVSTSKRSP